MTIPACYTCSYELHVQVYVLFVEDKHIFSADECTRSGQVAAERVPFITDELRQISRHLSNSQ